MSDNPQNTASAMTQIIRSVPSLTNLNLGGLEVWPSELEPWLHALSTMSCDRSALLFCRLLAARVRPAAFQPVATTTRARAFARKHHQWSRQSTLERRRPLRISNACRHTALKSCLKCAQAQPLPQFRPRDALMITFHLSACYYRRELAPGWAHLVLDTALLVLDTIEQSTHGWTVGLVEAEEAAAYLASHEGEERKRQPPLPPPPPSPPPSPPPWPPFISTSLMS